MTSSQTSTRAAVPAQLDFHTLSIPETLAAEEVDEQRGLSTSQAEERRRTYGPNRFAEGEQEPRWRAFLRQYADLMQIVLVVAGLGSIWPLKEYGTGLVLLAPDPLQRRAGPAAGGQGRRGRRGPAEDDDRQGEGAPGRPPGRAPGRGSRPR